MSKLATVVLAAGKSKRMHSRWTKLLHPLAGRPLTTYALRLAEALEPARLVIVLGHNAEEMRQALGHNYDYVTQEPQLGTGHALQQAQALLEGCCDELLVLYGDSPLIRLETLRAMLQHHRENNALLTLLSAKLFDPTGYGRVMRNGINRVRAIVEEPDATPEEKAIQEVNSGVLLFHADWLWQHLPRIPRSPKGEYYLTDLIGAAVASGGPVLAHTAPDPDEIKGVNNRAQLAHAEAVLRQRVAGRLMASGVTIVDPRTTYIDDTVEVGQDTVIHPNTHLSGNTRVGSGCAIGPNSILVDTVVGNGCQVFASVLEEALLEDQVDVGPFAHLRRGAHLARGVHMGNFGEVKNAYLGPGVKMGHFGYIGDAQIGADSNIGAGTITCNYDGVRKHRTIIGNKVFIGSDTMLVAPVEIGDKAITGAGAVVTKDVPPKSIAYGVPAKIRGTVEPNDEEEENGPAEGNDSD
jgi:bifunctional UDP-N-acetylglucosamine pyrophosphorylase/glucosamine-1-phosphate N-acetyltransferase